MELYIGNKNYSSWSMRPWLVLNHFDIPFHEVLVPFDDFKEDQTFKSIMKRVSPTAKVPTLVHQDKIVWDSLAICEYIAELFPEKQLWPNDVNLRATARALCAEMHSGFIQLRSLCSMNIEADLADIGAELWRNHPKLQQDVSRIEQIWSQREFQDGFLCGDSFSIVDAFYAPVVMRFLSYQLPISENAKAYIRLILSVPAVQQWMIQAKQEQLFVESQEPYRISNL